MNETIGFIGLGNLGLPMATNLLNAGYALRVYNRTASKAEPLVAQGAYLASQPADTAISGGIVASIVWDDAALEGIVTSDDFLDRLGPNGIHIAMSTVLPETSKKMADLHTQHGCLYVEAPVFGIPAAAVAHSLLMPIAGPQSAKDRVRPILEAMGANGIYDFGETVGAAVLVKLIGNFLIISAGNSMHEALTIATNRGVDPKAVVEMLTNTLFSSPIYKSYGKRLAENNMLFGQSKIPQKDIGLLQTTAKAVNTPTPIAALLNDILSQA